MDEIHSHPFETLVAEAVLGRGLFPVCIIDRGLVAHANTQLEELFGFGEGLVGRPLSSLAGPAEREKLARALVSAVNDGTRVHVQFQARRADGVDFEVAANIVRSGNPEAQTVVMSLFDVSGQRQSITELRLFAFSDPLTGLANRALFFDRLRNNLVQARRQGGSFGVMLADLDGFKEVNDSMGHAAGDAVLKAAAERMTEALRDGDTLARVGGDEFAVILPRLGRREDATQVAGRLVQGFDDPVPVDGGTVRIGLSVGVSTWPDNGQDVDGLYLQADRAMYAAKRAGKNRYHFADVRADAALMTYLPFFQWSSGYNVGVSVMDEHHKHLAELINELGRILKAGQGRDKLAAQFGRIRSFAQIHFAAEEAMVQRYLHAADDRHKQSHRRLSDALLNLSASLDKQSMALTMHYLQEWLFRHIEAEDRPLAAELIKCGVK